MHESEIVKLMVEQPQRFRYAPQLTAIIHGMLQRGAITDVQFREAALARGARYIDVDNIDWQSGTSMQKISNFMAVPVAAGTTVITRLPDGTIESVNVAEEGDMQIITPSGVTYLQSADSFKRGAVNIPNPLIDSTTGAIEYSPQLNPIQIIFVDEDTVIRNPKNGLLMRVAAGGAIARRESDGAVYTISSEELASNYRAVNDRDEVPFQTFPPEVLDKIRSIIANSRSITDAPPVQPPP